MTRAALFLIRRTMTNVFIRGVKRLREPRYAAGAAIAFMYFWWFLFRRGAVHETNVLRYGAGNDAMMLFVTGIAFAIIVGVWALPKNSPGLVFSEAEIQFFFAGPVSRRQLIAYKFVRSQIRGLFSAFMFSAFVFRGSHFFGVWLAFITIDVYTSFAAFARARLKLARIGWLWRVLVVAIVLTATFMIAQRQFQTRWDEVLTGDRRDIARKISAVVSEPPLAVIFALPRLFALALYAQSPAATATAAVILLLFAAMCFVLIMLLDVSFEDESLVTSQRALARRAQFRQGRMGRSTTAINRITVPFWIVERGPAAGAIAWKNLVGTLRMSSFPVMGIVLIATIVTGAVVFHDNKQVVTALGGMGLMLAGVVVLTGPQVLRSDMRVDILRLDVVKTFPVSAEALLAAEMAAPLLVLAIFELLLLGVSVTALNLAAEYVVSALVFVIPVCAIQLLIHNGAILVFPAWSMNPDETRGFTAVGQRLLMFIGNLAALAVALVPAALLFVPSLWVITKMFGASPIGVLIATLPAAAVLIAEIVLALKLLAAQFENLDIANE
jgi:hypothetical protein